MVDHGLGEDGELIEELRCICVLYQVHPFSSLSLVTSVRELISRRDSRLNMLDVFRVMAIVWVMINHTGSEGRVDILERKSSAIAFKVSIMLL